MNKLAKIGMVLVVWIVTWNKPISNGIVSFVTERNRDNLITIYEDTNEGYVSGLKKFDTKEKAIDFAKHNCSQYGSKYVKVFQLIQEYDCDYVEHTTRTIRLIPVNQGR